MPASATPAKLKVPFYGHGRQYHNIKREIDDAFHAVMESEAYVMGPALARFEKELAQYFAMKHAVGLNSGTDALWLAFLALGIQPGDEVITTANTFFATAEAIWRQGRLRRFRPGHEQHRPHENRSRHHTTHRGHRPRASLRPLRRYEGRQHHR